jgi:NAD-dependent dihydropyrimidine dehydrogenase PreA subunit
MAFVIAEPCIGTKDTACVDACPVDCIHPKKNTTYDDARPGFDEIPQLYIDPVECIDCGACVPVCPVSAISCAGRPARKVEALHGTKRELRPGRQVHTRRVRQAQRNEVGAQEKPNHSPSPRSLSEARSVCPTSPMRAHNPDRFFPSRPEATTTIPGFRRPPNWTTKSASGSVKPIDRRGNCRRSNRTLNCSGVKFC